METPFPAIMYAEDGEIVLLNLEWEKLTGYNRGKVKTISTWLSLAYGSEKALLILDIEALFGLDKPLHEGERSVRTQSGEVRIWDFSATPVGKLPDGRRLMLSLARDFTELKKIEEGLKRAIVARDEFLSIASHELKAPLTSIKLQLHMMDRILPKNEPNLAKIQYVEKAGVKLTRQTEKINRLIEDMHDFSRIATRNL